MRKKIVLITGKKSQFLNSGVGKYILNYIPYLEKKYKVEIFYQPENHNIITGNLWRLFKLPSILKNKYEGYIKIISDESLLISLRKNYLKSTIAIIHHYPFKTRVTNLKEHIIRRLSYITFNTILKKTDHIIAVSNKTKEILMDIGINEKYITIIPNSIDLTLYKQLSDIEKKQKRTKYAQIYNLPIEKRWLLYVGSNESRKNILTLFKTLSLLSDNYILIRVGKDCSLDELNKMNKIIKENNLKNKYYLLQDLSEEDLISLYQISDIYIMPSLYEGFGRPIIEAQACGCPVISTKCGALEEVCGKGALLIENPMDEMEYLQNINKISIVKDTIIKEGIINAYKYSTYLNSIYFYEMLGKL